MPDRTCEALRPDACLAFARSTVTFSTSHCLSLPGYSGSPTDSVASRPRCPEEAAANALADLDKLAVFSGVREFPVRVKCATLPWHTLVAALDRATQPVKTE